ncbi:MAG: DNA polymerase III subunit gamma/tau [Proteobacteria bacterium]|nr:DNA polymerase III subunit gamma/tau [Pseudomonadota bacterium]
MNYTVIARRWRPKRFEDVVGQPHIVTTIKNSIKHNRVAHAYLFTGPRGVGKTSLARIIAKAMNCIGGPKEEPCGICENCTAIDNGSFVDVIEIDAASTRGIDDIRELTETVRYMPMKGTYKLYILDEAHMLTPQARDAFLKTLEEPPGNNIFILATTEPQKIPYTIMSRCQRFDFKRISEREIVNQLKLICEDEKIKYDESAFSHIAVEADGSMRDAESLLDQIIAYSGDFISEKDVISVIGIVEKEILYDLIKSILDENLKAGLEIIEKTLNDGYDTYQVYEGLISFLRNMMILKVYGSIPPFFYMGEEEYRKIAELLKGIEYYEIQNMLNYMLRSEDMFKGIFQRISLEILYINLYNISKLRDVEKMIDSLSKHEHTEGSVHDKYDKLVEEHNPPEPQFKKDLKGFIEYLKQKKPFMSSILQSLEIKIDGANIVVFIDKNYNFIKEDASLKDDIRQYSKIFFGNEMGLIFKGATEKKKDMLEDYVKEADSLFKV